MASVVLAGSPATGREAARPAEHGEYGSDDDTVQLQLARLHGSPRLSCCLGCLLNDVQEGFIPGFESSDREGDECLSGRPALHSWMAVVHKTTPTAICLFAHSPTLSPLLLAGTKKAPVSSIAVEDGRFCRAEEWCCLFLRLVLACAPWHVHVGELLTTFVLRNDTQSKGLCVSGGAPAGSFSCTRECTRNLSPRQGVPSMDSHSVRLS